MALIVHLSDLHFGPKFNTHLSELILEDIRQTKPDLTILSGDLTMRGRASEYEQARAYIAELPPPVFTIPGNHDQPLAMEAGVMWQRATRPWKLYTEYIREQVDSSIELPGLFVVGVNSNHPIIPGGIWSVAQRAFVTQEFARAPSDACKIFVTHHHLEWNGKWRPFGTWFPTAQLQWLSKLGVELILNGHTHVPLTTQTAQGIVIAQAGTSMSTRVRHGHGNAYNRILIERSALTIRVLRYDETVDRFVQFDVKSFTRKGVQESAA
jgi:3',5'-cyclic AMP phosphodiesterase CpdA